MNKINTEIITSFILGLALFMITSCNWNRTERAQQQIYAPGPDAPSPLRGTLQRKYDYYSESDGDLLKKMR